MKKLTATVCLATSLLFFGAAGCGVQEGLPPKQEEEETTMEEISFGQEDFSGKTVVVYGDSITYGAGTSGAQSVWIHHLAQELGFVYANFAVNGAMLTYRNAVRDGRGSGAEYILREEETNAIADYAFLFFGANDFTHGVKVGENDETVERLEDVASFKQGIRWATETLRKQNPAIKIVFITPLYRNDVTISSYGFEISAFGDAIKEMSALLRFYYVDTTGFFTPENCGPYSELTADQLHPNDLGQRKLYEWILERGIEH